MSAQNNLGRQFDENEQVYKVPAVFFDDHVNRHNDPHEMLSRIVKSTKTHHHVRLTDDQASDLESDASYYADSSPEYVDRKVINSAKATVKAMNQ